MLSAVASELPEKKITVWSCNLYIDGCPPFSDIQAGIESALALSTTIRSGANFILHACGILSSFVAMSYEKFIIDEEPCGI
ncbi:MAG: trimethylamine methyltransferase family protein [Desulfobacterales bacterium]